MRRDPFSPAPPQREAACGFAGAAKPQAAPPGAEGGKRLIWPWLPVAVWAVAVLAVCGRALVSPRAHSVYPIFAEAGRRWLGGEGLYPEPEGGLDRFRYSPPVAALFAPLSLLPDGLAGCLWRVVNAGAYLGALAW